MTSAGWSILGDAERGRLLDIKRRLRPVEQRAVVLYVVASLAAVPAFGWLVVVPMLPAGVVFWYLERRLNRYRRPEWVLAALWLLSELVLACGIALATGPREYLLSLLVFPTVLASVVFPPRAVVAGTLLTALLMVGLALGFDAHLVSATPPILSAPLVVLACLTMTASKVRDLDVASRGTAVVDRLTSTLNRTALSARASELSEQGAAVALIVLDVDGFKAVNDREGHAIGDAVLTEVAHRLGACIDAFEPVYRFGGDEFVVLLCGERAAHAASAAERLCRAVAAQPVAGLAVTISAGVAAPAAGRPFDFESAFRRADAALYAAKSAGRDRVRVSDSRGGDPARHLDVVAGPGAHVAAEDQTFEDDIRRQHVLALNSLLRRNFRRCSALGFAVVVAAAPWFGWATIIPPVLAGIAYNAIQFRVERLRRPERALAIGWLLMQAGIGGGFALAHNAPLFALPLLTLLVLGSGAVYPPRQVLIGLLYTAAMMILTALHLDAREVISSPATVLFPLALLVTAGSIGSALGRSAIDYRSAAIRDELTGTLNRGAWDARVAEVMHQANAGGRQVALLIGDLDRFKTINDRHGHSSGDLVLKEIGHLLRAQLRALEPVYRIGGEEFAVLLTGAGADAAVQVAERLCRAVREAPIAGLDVTISFGVAASDAGEPFDYEALFARADAALYTAKRSGRDRVVSGSVFTPVEAGRLTA